jgi:sulfur-carrier protein adenylyltransferase/sulfurtransferase
MTTASGGAGYAYCVAPVRRRCTANGYASAMDPRDRAIAAAREQVSEISPTEAQQRVAAGALLLDIREDAERIGGTPVGAIGVSRSYLEMRIGALARDAAVPLVLMCSGGTRSLLAARNLCDLGYRDVASVSGGFDRWKAEGRPIAVAGGTDPDWLDRYSRHLRLPEVGEAGQRALSQASVLLVGAGGLGSPAALYLAAAGVGRIGLVDDDRVERSNLQRQVLHADARIGMLKVESARTALAGLNPRLRIDTHACRLAAANVDAVLSPYDVIIDGADNFPTRYLLSDACVKLAKPLVYGAVQRFDGQLMVFDAGRRRGESPCYRCLFPQPPPPEAAPNCAEAGVLGVLPGVIGLLQATEALKLLLGIGESLDGRLLTFDALSMRFRESRLRPDPDCAVCAPGRAFAGYEDYAALCAAG